MPRTLDISLYEVKISNDWSISNKINSLSTMNFEIVDLNEYYTHFNKIPECGEVIRFIDTNTSKYLFYGIIDNIRSYQLGYNKIIYEIEAIEYAHILTNRVLAFIAEEMTAKELIQSYIAPSFVSTDLNIAINQLDTGIYIKKAIFNYQTIDTILDTIISYDPNYFYKIDINGFTFAKKNQFSSPFNISDSSQVYNFELQTSNENYRNSQYVKGGKGNTSLQTNELLNVPDGESKNYFCKYPISLQPTIMVYNGTWQTIPSTDVGISNLDTGKKWYWSYNSNVIYQDNSETALTTSMRVRITYYGLRNIFMHLKDSRQIDLMKTTAVKSGIYDNINTESSISSLESGIAYIRGLMSKYSELSDKISFKTNTDGLEVGQYITVNKPLFGINSNFLIESINLSAELDTYEYSITAIDGASLGGWEEFFKKLSRAGEKVEINENDFLNKLELFEEIITNYGNTAIDIYEDGLIIGNSLYPSNTLYPSTAKSTESFEENYNK